MERSYAAFLRKLDTIGIRSQLEKRSLKNQVSLERLYGTHARGSELTSAARADVYVWLAKRGMGINEIARLFDRAPSGVMKLLRRNG